MSDAEVDVTSRRRISSVWLIPIVAALLGIWMVIYTIQSEGPDVTIVFSSAEGLEAGKTKVKMLSVEVGLVESVRLGDDFESVVVEVKLEKVATPLLREDTQFWVVRARVGTEGVSGLGTLLSGGYIQLAPGTGPEGRREFVGLDQPPVTPAGTPGLHFHLTSDDPGALSRGDPILYKGYRVGRIEDVDFDVPNRTMRFAAFIEAPHDDLVTTGTRFWNASGISVSATADGIHARMASVESLLLGGVSFGLPLGVVAGSPAEDGAQFELHPNYASVNDRPYLYSLAYVVEFEQSVRGLKPDAPVEYRGIRVGRVDRILMTASGGKHIRGQGQSIPVLIRLEPGRMELGDSKEGTEILAQAVERGIGNGMRASLATGSLITGSKFVNFDVYPNAEPAEIGRFEGYPTIPSIASGLEGIQVKVSQLLDQINALPIPELLDRIDNVLSDLNTLLANEAMQQLPQSLEATLGNLRGVLGSVSTDSALQERLLRTLNDLDRTLQSMQLLIDEQPNAVIFDRDLGEDPRPPAGSP